MSYQWKTILVWWHKLHKSFSKILQRLSFFKYSEKMVSPKKSALEYDLFCIQERFFSRKKILFFRWKWKDDLSKKKNKKNMEIWYFCVYVKMLQISYYPSTKKKLIFPRKNTLKSDISGITKKDDIHPRKYGISVEIPYWLTF